MQASAFFTILSLSAALNTRLVRFGVVSTAAPLAPSACSRRSASGRISRTGTGDVLGKVAGPFSAHRHLRFQKGLVESRRSAVACRAGGAYYARRLSLSLSPRSPSLRFSSPLIKPDVTISVIRLSDGIHAEAFAVPDFEKVFERKNAQLPEHSRHRKLSVSRPGDLVPSAEKAPDRVVQVSLHIVPRLRHRAIGEVPRPSPQGAVQVTDYVFPRRLISVSQSSTNRLLDGGDRLPGRPGTIVTSAGSR